MDLPSCLKAKSNLGCIFRARDRSPTFEISERIIRK
jgi:hypothetical protein